MKRDGDDLLETLIQLNQREELSRDEINHLLLRFIQCRDRHDIRYSGMGNDRTFTKPRQTIEAPERNKRQYRRRRAQESDIPRLPYLQAVVKETFRLHPIGPLLVPHKADVDVEINGYTIPKDAQILVNVWASGRDPSVWQDADMFVPERFLDREIDFRGQDFELIPFGAGRRICPGLPMAHRMVHLMLATFVGDFGWQLEEELDMDEKFGITLQRAIPLKAVPMKL
ncbi:hypothetical protein CASFOL_005891 [Castilleja foliolosa]|uniref:Cytochrome P450 n=1 Tax=Castilleja foliolosa TaxID=1961234 RepID=A0ABD3E543_9LAMI